MCGARLSRAALPAAGLVLLHAHCVQAQTDWLAFGQCGVRRLGCGRCEVWCIDVGICGRHGPQCAEAVRLAACWCIINPVQLSDVLVHFSEHAVTLVTVDAPACWPCYMPHVSVLDKQVTPDPADMKCVTTLCWLVLACTASIKQASLLQQSAGCAVGRTCISPLLVMQGA